MAKFLQKKFVPGAIALLLVCGFFIFGTNKILATTPPDFVQIFTGVHDTLVGQGIANNIDTCGTTPTACAGLYFEKVGYGKITFSGDLNLTDQATIDLLQSLNTKLEITEGHIKFDASTATALKNAGASIEMSGLDYATQPDLMVKDDAGNILTDTSFVDGITYTNCAISPGTSGKCFTFNTQHFTTFDLQDKSNKYVATTGNDTNDGSATSPYQTIAKAITEVPAGGTVNLAEGTYELTSQLNISKALSLVGQGVVNLKAVSDYGKVNGSKHLLTVYAGTETAPVNLSNIALDCDSKCYGFNTYSNAYVVLNDVTVKNSKGAGLTINGSTLSATNLKTSGNAWGAVNVDPGTGVTTPSVFTITGTGSDLAESTQIWSDGSKVSETATVTVNAEGYTKYAVGGQTTPYFTWKNKSLSNVAVIIKNDTPTLYSTLISAVKDAQEGDTIKVTPGDYNLTKDDVTSVAGQTGWYLPISQNSITLMGVNAQGQEITKASDVVTNIYSTQETANGAWASQNLITVFGNNVTFKGLGIMNKISPNKAIEVLGDNFKAENCQFLPVPKTLFAAADNYDGGDDITKYGSGVYFNNNSATATRTGTITNNIFKNSGITFDSFGNNWTVNIEGNTFDGNKIWKSGGVDYYYSSIGATTWANQPDFTGSTIEIRKNKFINTVNGQVIVKIKDTMTGQFDAKENWWGTTDDTVIKAKTLGDVLFNPWYTSEAMTSLAQPLSATTTISGDTTEVVVNSDDSTDSEINIPEDVTDATINVASLLVEGETSDTVTLPAAINIKSDTSLGAVEVAMPAGMEISSDSGDNWNGVINAPQIKLNSSVTPTADSGKEATVSAVVEVGYGDTKLTFNKAVRIIIAGQAGKEAGYSRSGVFTRISTICSADTQVAGDALPAEGDCKIDVGSDLVIWTKHFTSFVSYTQANIPSGGGGNGGGGGGVPNATSACVSVDYEDWQTTCVNNLQYRNIKALNPIGCVMTVAQREASQRACSVAGVKVEEPKSTTTENKPAEQGKVLGAKAYANGTLLKGTGPKIYLLVDGKKYHIKTLKELWSYRGKKIIKVADEVLAQYSDTNTTKVAGKKIVAKKVVTPKVK